MDGQTRPRLPPRIRDREDPARRKGGHKLEFAPGGSALSVSLHSARRAMRAVALVLLISFASAHAEVRRGNLTLDDLFDTKGTVDVAVSPSGQWFAGVIRVAERDMIVVANAETGESKVIATVGIRSAGDKLEARITAVYWKSDERILFRSSAVPADGVSSRHLLRSFKRLGQ